MNIFYLDQDPKKAATYFYKRHKVKMILESAQMLCTAHRVLDPDCDVPYKIAHKNHPSTIWVRSSKEHYMWLYDHMIALGEEYTKLYGKTHLTIKKCLEPLKNPPTNIPDVGFQEPPQCMPVQYKVDGSSIKAYWNYYIGEKHSVRVKGEELVEQPI